MTAIETILQQLAVATQRGEDKRVLLQLVDELRMAVLDMPLILNPEIIEQLEAPPRRALAAKEEMPAAPATTAPVVARVPHVAATTVRPPTVLRAPLPPRTVVAVEEDAEPAPAPAVSAPAKAVPPVAAPAQAPNPVPAVHDRFVDEQLLKMQAAHQHYMPAPAPVEAEVLELPVTEDMLEEVGARQAPIEEAAPVKMSLAEPAPVRKAAPVPNDGLPAGRRAELHEVLAAQPATSLNERFSQPTPVLAEVIAGPRVADLRKAISVAEKFQYVNELFRQDETLFERSIKTINSFDIYAEAEYWIRRELASRIGWDEKSALVQQFYALVRRRFS